MMATSHITPIIVTARLNVVIFGYFKGLNMETKRFRVKRKMFPVVAETRKLATVIKMLKKEL
jgi:hypothetical protein